MADVMLGRQDVMASVLLLPVHERAERVLKVPQNHIDPLSLGMILIQAGWLQHNPAIWIHNTDSSSFGWERLHSCPSFVGQK